MTYDLSTGWTVALLFALAWELGWKGVGLWYSARREQTSWFIAMLVINSFGILPMVYLMLNGTKFDNVT